MYAMYVVVLAMIKPGLMPPLSAAERFVPLPALTEPISMAISNTALPALLRALKGGRNLNVPIGHILRQLGVALVPAALFVLATGMSWHLNTAPPDAAELADSARAQSSADAEAGGGGLQAPPGSSAQAPEGAERSGLAEPPSSDEGGLALPPGADNEGLAEPPGADDDAKEPSADEGVKEPSADDGAEGGSADDGVEGGSADDGAKEPGADDGAKDPPGSEGLNEPPQASLGVQEPPTEAAAPAERTPATRGWWTGAGVGALALFGFYAMLSFQRLEIFKMLMASFFPLLIMILAVLGSIVLGLATPTEAAAVGALGGFLLALAYRQFNLTMLKESVYLTAKTTAMVCWLFVGSAIFSAAFALLGGQALVENWVMSLNLTTTQFLILSQVIIFILGWPLEWTEIIVIFMPIFIPLLDNFGVDPLFFGLLVALNLQTAFLSPPVAMAAFYLKGVSPPHVTLNQIFAGMLPFMGIQVIAIVMLYQFPAIGLWLPSVLYR